MKLKISKFIRIITTAPICALALITSLLFARPDIMNYKNYFVSIITLVILPLLAYPLAPLLPRFKKKGRDGERTLAMIMAVAGYIVGIIYSIIAKIPVKLLEVYLTYLFSGIILFAINKLFKLKASGHACGIAGPSIIAAVYLGAPAIVIGILVYLLSLWASLVTKRHTVYQFLGGAVIPILTFFGVSFVLA